MFYVTLDAKPPMPIFPARPPSSSQAVRRPTYPDVGHAARIPRIILLILLRDTSGTLDYAVAVQLYRSSEVNH